SAFVGLLGVISGLIAILNFLGLTNITAFRDVFNTTVNTLSAFGWPWVAIVAGVIAFAVVAELAFFRRPQRRAKMGPWLPRLRLLLSIILLAVVAGSTLWLAPRAHSYLAHLTTATTVQLYKLPATSWPGSISLGTLSDFETDDPGYTCLRGRELQWFFVPTFR